MDVQEKVLQPFAQAKAKWWYWPLLTLGSITLVGGIVWLIIV